MKTGLFQTLAVGLLGLLATPAMVQGAPERAFMPPSGLEWGMSPEQAQQKLKNKYTFEGPEASAATLNNIVFEQTYQGEFWGMYADQISTVFYLGGLVSVSVTFPRREGSWASKMWYQLVGRMQNLAGPPDTFEEPEKLISEELVGRLYPDETYRNKMLALYEKAVTDKENGRYILYDFQIKAGNWVPKAVWQFSNGVAVKILMRASEPDEKGKRVLKPVWIFNQYEAFK